MLLAKSRLPLLCDQSGKSRPAWPIAGMAWHSAGEYNQPVMIPPELLEILVCPVCKKRLVLKHEGESLQCGECHRVYPIRDGIPILLVDEAVIEPD